MVVVVVVVMVVIDGESEWSERSSTVDRFRQALKKEKKMLRFRSLSSSLVSFIGHGMAPTNDEDALAWECGRWERSSSGGDALGNATRPSIDDGFFRNVGSLSLLTSLSSKTKPASLQLTIYDDCHFSDYVAVIAQFNHERTAQGAAGGELTALAWVAPARRSSKNPPLRPDSAFEDRDGEDASGSAVPGVPTATDALVAVAGSSGQVSVVSVSQCAVVALLGDAGISSSSEPSSSSPGAAAAGAAAGPSSSTSSSRLPAVVALAGAPDVPGLLAALDAAGAITLWDCLSGRPLTTLDVGADTISVALSPDGKMLATGHRGGSVRTCPVPDELVARCGRQPGLEGGRGGGENHADDENNDGATADGDKTPLPFSHPAARPQPALPAAAVCERVDSLTVEVEEKGGDGNGGNALLPPEFRRRRAPHSAPVESVRFLSNSRLASKASDGSVVVFEFSKQAAEGAAQGAASPSPASVVSSFRAPGCGLGAGGASARCPLSATRDGAYLASGTPSGEVHVFETATGKRAGKVGAAPRLKEAVVRAVALSDDCRHLVVAAGVGFVFRFEARAAAPAVVEVAAAATAAAPEEQPPTADAS